MCARWQVEYLRPDAQATNAVGLWTECANRSAANTQSSRGPYVGLWLRVHPRLHGPHGRALTALLPQMLLPLGSIALRACFARRVLAPDTARVDGFAWLNWVAQRGDVAQRV